MKLSPDLLLAAGFLGITIALALDRTTHVAWWMAAVPCLLLSGLFLTDHISDQKRRDR